MTYEKIDIGNVRGVAGEKGEKGDRGATPSYDDLRYKKKGDEFDIEETQTTTTITNYYLDKDGHLCDEDGYLYDDEGNLTENQGTPFDVNVYGYEYKQLYVDEDNNFTDEQGRLYELVTNELGESVYRYKYIISEFISDVANYIYMDEDSYEMIVNSIYPHVADSLTDITNSAYADFFNLIEGDIKYYVCVDDPQETITISENTISNTCGYIGDDGNIVYDNSHQKVPVPLEKNALYLYKSIEDNDDTVMHYDIYVCLKANTVPVKLVSSRDFTLTYNIIKNILLTTTDEDEDGENEVWLNFTTRGTDAVYTKSEVDTLLLNNLINKLGANNGIAQLNGSGKVPASQLPAYIDDVVEGTMNSAETVFTPSNNDYIDSVQQTGKIYVDTSTKKTYRWTGSQYTFISNPIVVDDSSTTAFSSTKGSTLETKIGNTTLDTTATTVTGAINELNSGKENVSNKTKTFASTINGLSDDKYPTEKLVKLSLNGKSDNGHTHNKSDITDFAHTHNKSDITNFAHTHNKSDITDFAHTHDDRYYTETETNTLLNSKLNTNQGSNNSGKYLKVSSNGDVTCEEVTIPQQTSDANDVISDVLDALTNDIVVSSDKSIVQSGDNMTVTATKFTNPNDDVLIYALKNSFSNPLNVNTNGFVANGNNISVSNGEGAIITDGGRVYCNVPFVLGTGTTIISLKCKSMDESNIALSGQIGYSTGGDEYNTGFTVSSSFGTAFGETPTIYGNMNGIDVHDWMDVRFEITPTSQRLYVNNIYMSEEDIDYSNDPYIGDDELYFTIWTDGFSFMIKDFDILVCDEIIICDDNPCSGTYTGVGKGAVQLGARLRENCNVVSETYSVIDGTFKDTSTLHNTKWWATGTLNIDVQSDGILVENNNSSTYVLDYLYLTDNFPSSWIEREQAVTCNTVPFAVEFDFVSASDLSATGLYIGTPSTNLHYYFNYLNITTGKVKLEVTGSQVKIKVNNEDKTPITLNVTGDVRFGFRINAGNSFKYDNLIVYPI